MKDDSIFSQGPLERGTVLDGRYEILELIKSGGMGAVYKAVNCKLESICAVKELLPFELGEEEHEKAREWFKREARLLARLDHPGMPKVFDYFIINDRYYLVMNFVDGEDLLCKLDREGNPGLPEEKVVGWAIEILRVLDYLHKQDPVIIYRDLKPANIMLHRDGRIVLIDFGLARAVHNFSIKKTARGTFGYAPVEQYEGEAEPRSDIYSLGATIHHLLTGMVPFSFNFEPIRKIVMSLSPELEAIIMKALENNKEERFSSAGEMLDSLLELAFYLKHKGQVKNRLKSVRKIWEFSADNIIGSGALAVNYHIYFGSDDNRFYCVEADTGEKVWEFETEGKVKSTPFVSGEFIYFGSYDNKLYCLNRRIGMKIWEFETGFRVHSDPVVYNNFLYFGSHDNKFYCLNSISGMKLWEFESGDWIYSTPLFYDGFIYFASRDGTFYCLDGQKGKVVWGFKAGHRIYSGSCLYKNFIYFGCDDKKLYCLEAKTGKKHWEFETDGWIRNNPCIFQDFLYFGSDKLYCLEPLSGRKMWDFQDENGDIKSSLNVSLNVYFGTSDGLYCLDSTSGEMLWKFNTDNRVLSRPCIEKERIYFGCHNSRFYCLEASTGEEDDKISSILACQLRLNLKNILFK